MFGLVPAMAAQGVGVYFFKSGDKYQGSWAGGQREGRGRMEYANGDIYDGEWVADQRVGAGVLISGVRSSRSAHETACIHLLQRQQRMRNSMALP